MDSIVHTLKENWAVIAQAPWAFLVWTAVIAGALWAVLSYLKSDQIAALEARIKLRDDKISDLERIERSSSATADELAGEARQQRRRAIIADGRRLVAQFSGQSDVPFLMQFLQTHPEWHAIRPHLDPKVRGHMENGRLVVLTAGNDKDGKLSYLVQELDRLEREWGLL